MSFSIPTLSQVIDRVKGDLNTRMGNSNALIPRSLAWVVAHVVAGAVWGLYLYQQWISKQTIPDSAESVYLERWARIFGIYRTAAQKASGSANATAVSGSSVSAGAILQRNDGIEYAVTADHTWTTSGAEAVSVESSEAGVAGNATSGTGLTFVSPPAGVVADATVASPGFTDGQDAESDASLLTRLLQRIQDPPQGGSVADYEAWVRTAGALGGFEVDRVWVEAWTTDESLDPGSVAARFTLSDSSGVGAGGVFPDFAQGLQVFNYIKGLGDYSGQAVKPVAADFSVEWPDEHEFTLDLNAHLDGTADASTVTDRIVAELRSTFADRTEVQPDGYTIHNSDLHDAVDAVEGIEYYAFTDVDGTGSPTGDLTLGAYGYPTVEAANIHLIEV